MVRAFNIRSLLSYGSLFTAHNLPSYTNLPSSVYLRCRCVALLDVLLSTPASAPRCRLGLHLECKLVLYVVHARYMVRFILLHFCKIRQSETGKQFIQLIAQQSPYVARAAHFSLFAQAAWSVTQSTRVQDPSRTVMISLSLIFSGGRLRR